MAHIYGLPISILILVPDVRTVKHAHIICYMLEFPSSFIKLCNACEEMESNAKCSRFWGYFIDGISLTREKYWYEIRDVLVPIFHVI